VIMHDHAWLIGLDGQPPHLPCESMLARKIGRKRLRGRCAIYLPGSDKVAYNAGS